MIKQSYYTTKKIDACKAKYNLIFGERSNGKTYSILKKGVENYIKNTKQMAYIRRWRDDFVGKRGSVLFNALVNNGEIKKLSKGAWDGVYYRSSQWFLTKHVDGDVIVDDTPFCYGFSLSSQEHDKSTSFPNITLICFDEFITRQGYLPDEFILFANVLSTIIRERDDVTVYMLGNTVNKTCPYFSEMGLKHIKDMEQGAIDVYTYANSSLTVAVEYCKPKKQGKKSDVYFAFDNPKLNMITSGAWELDIYPRCPNEYDKHDIIFTFFIKWDGDVFQCEILTNDNQPYIFIHRKSGDIKYHNDLVYSSDYDTSYYHARFITEPRNNIERRIYNLFKHDRVFYQDNEVGDAIYNYLQWCG